MARRTKADAQATRASLLDAAEHLFQSRGVARTSLNDIALAAGTSRGAIYWHFKDKADLFNAMMERVTLPLEQTLALADLERTQDPVSQLRHAFLQALRLIARDEQTHRVLLIATHKVEFTDELCAVQQRHQRSQDAALLYIRTALSAAFALKGKAPPVPLEAAAGGLQMLIEGLVNQWLPNPEAFGLVKTGVSVLDVYLAGLGLLAPLKTLPKSAAQSS